MKATGFIFLLLIPWAAGLIPPKFQWKVIEFAWENNATRDAAVTSGDYVAVHNMPTGLARWKDKLFITIPRWKKGVPSSLNYISLNGSQDQPLNPFPSWQDGFVKDSAPQPTTPATVVSTFRVHVDKCDRLWVVDNGVSDMANSAKQVSAPALIVFELQNNTVVNRFVLPDDVLRDTSVFTSIVVDIIGKGCKDAYAYITDMGSNAIVVYSLTDNTAWRIEHPHFNFDPNAGIYKVGGIDFYWNDGVSSAALSRPKKDGFRDLYLHPTSSTKQFKMSTKLLRNKNADPEDIIEGVEVVGDRGPKSQATACDFDLTTNVLFFTQVSKNGFGCWNVERPFIKEFTPIVMKDCSLMEFPNDIKVDHEGNLWVLSDRQARFLYEAMDFNQVNFRVLTAPIAQVIQGTPCEKNKSNFCFFKRMKIK